MLFNIVKNQKIARHQSSFLFIRVAFISRLVCYYLFMVKMEEKIKEKLAELITAALTELGISGAKVSLERPGELAHGDYATNVAMAAAKAAGSCRSA